MLKRFISTMLTLMYYIDPVTTSRPVTANYYTFYKNKNYTGKIGSYDYRYKLWNMEMIENDSLFWF